MFGSSCDSELSELRSIEMHLEWIVHAYRTICPEATVQIVNYRAGQ